MRLGPIEIFFRLSGYCVFESVLRGPKVILCPGLPGERVKSVNDNAQQDNARAEHERASPWAAQRCLRRLCLAQVLLRRVESHTQRPGRQQGCTGVLVLEEPSARFAREETQVHHLPRKNFIKIGKLLDRAFAPRYLGRMGNRVEGGSPAESLAFAPIVRPWRPPVLILFFLLEDVRKLSPGLVRDAFAFWVLISHTGVVPKESLQCRGFTCDGAGGREGPLP